jgi:AcrR family transcriptional regulator
VAWGSGKLKDGGDVAGTLDIQVCLVDYTDLSVYRRCVPAMETDDTVLPPGQPRDPLRAEGARERILETAYRLFSRHGVHAVGIDRVIAEADVAKATLYHHFASKEALVIAFLELRHERWTVGWLQVEAERRAAHPRDRVLAIFDAFDEWFHHADFEGCSFINTLLEISDRASLVHREAVRHLAAIRDIIVNYAEQAGARSPLEVGAQLQIILIGTIVSARRGELDAARRARPLASLLLASARA